jgi:hypothetical protein
MDDYMTKPVDPKQLDTVLANYSKATSAEAGAA